MDTGVHGLFGDVLIGLVAGMLFAAALKNRISTTVLVIGSLAAFCFLVAHHDCGGADACLTAAKADLDGVVGWILDKTSIALGWALGLGVGHVATRPRKAV